ncbi:DegT/DnrJ/EryC1/StrS family aminotransferase [Mesobacillus harenae]|uniref:DegT/DnrJ/EryC1/StrS family aminotransferase n=1 Tax=Mesobacillus harenae TaxID=2213203 RepID=UPI0024117473|nr:DegT/DnrJ/EryC1/StrS family aminotransferase [Mesobacillus harenae]
MKYVQEAFDTNWIAPVGLNVNEFEKEICNFTKAKQALALSTGTAGIHLALKYLGVKKDDYVFCSSLTFSASCYPILYEGAVPVFIDSEPNTWNMSPVALEKAFEWAHRENKIPKAVIIVDLYGQSADWDALIPICRRYNVPIVEDAAEGLGATYKGKHCGTFGEIGIFSFNGNKIITTSGGGIAVSNDEKAIKKMFFWSTQSREQVRHYEHKEVGYNYRMSNISAGIGRGQLEILADRIAKKKYIFSCYEKGLKDLPVKMLPVSSDGQSNYWLSVMTIDEESLLDRDEIIDALEEENIESRPVWKPMHLQPLFSSSLFFSSWERKSVAEDLFVRGVCLPSDSKMTDEDIKRTISIMKRKFEEAYEIEQKQSLA